MGSGKVQRETRSMAYILNTALGNTKTALIREILSSDE